MTDSGIFDSYLICQALGWEWNFWNMIVLSVAPILLIGLTLFVIFYVVPFILKKINRS